MLFSLSIVCFRFLLLLMLMFVSSSLARALSFTPFFSIYNIYSYFSFFNYTQLLLELERISYC